MRQKQRLQEFEALRGLSILLLLALHSEVFDSSVFGFNVGPLAEVVASFLLGSFFFLAGFFTEFSLRKPGDGIYQFVKSKFIRIFPPYWLALILFIFVLGFSLKPFDKLVYILNMQWVLSPVFVKRVLTLWYISLLAGYYLIFGVFFHWIKSNQGLLLWSMSLFGLTYAANMAIGLIEPRFFQYYFIFLAGMYYYRLEDIRNRLLKMRLGYLIVFAFIVLLPFWFVASRGYDVTNGLYIMTADFFILGWVLMWLSIFRTQAGNWKLWGVLSAASFFTYLYHRPIWHILDVIFGIEAGMGKIFFNLIFGGVTALIIGYFLQQAYDRLLGVLGLK